MLYLKSAPSNLSKIGSTFSKVPGYTFSEGPGPGPGPLYKVCHIFLDIWIAYYVLLPKIFRNSYYQIYFKIKEAFIFLKDFELQSWRKYMRQTLALVWNSALREKFNINFWTFFRLYWRNFHFGRKTGHQAIILSRFGIFLIFPNFLVVLSGSATREATRIYHVYY